MLLSIDLIRTDGGTQPREAVSLEVVDTYMDAMNEGAKFPPIDVFYDGSEYWLADGFHRVKAAYQADKTEIEATVHQGTLADAQWFSFGANKANGLYRSNADKQRAVKAALSHEKSLALSDQQIATHCGVARTTVLGWREKLSCHFGKIETRTVTRSGTTYRQNTANIGRKAAVADPIVTSQVEVEDYPELEISPELDAEPEPPNEVRNELDVLGLGNPRRIETRLPPEPLARHAFHSYAPVQPKVDMDLEWAELLAAIRRIAERKMTASEFVSRSCDVKALATSSRAAFEFIGFVFEKSAESEKRTA